MKQTFLSACVLGLALSLSACGGGGGGGDSSSGMGGTAFTISGMAGNATSRSAPALSDADQTASALASLDSGMQEKMKQGYSMRLWDTTLQTESNGSVTLKYDDGDPDDEPMTTTFKPGDMRFYTKDGVDFVAMMDAPQTKSDFPENESGFKGSITSKNALWVGKLDYASFGYWAWVMDVQGTVEGNQIKATALVEYDYFYDGKPAQYDGSNLSFTGIALGTAFYMTGNSASTASANTIPLMGTASLNITDASTGSLVLSFPNFYKFTGSVSTSPAGLLSGRFTDLQKSGSTFPVDLPSSADQLNDNFISGQLYGSNPTTPTEAAGAWGLDYKTDTSAIFANGVFGVKKK